jgi:lipoyl(octanoyl) transferase 2
MLLRHLHLAGLTHYTYASVIQNRLVSALLAHKAKPSTPPPDPTLITAEFHPVYTCGRREIGNVSKEQTSFLQQPVPDLGQAEFKEALRGGQTTFHGPGQLVAYPILDLRRHSQTARCYVNLLESAVIATCKVYGLSTQRTDNPGVWTDDTHKICALGVHLRRNVSSHGVGLNVSTNLRWFDRIVACGLEGKKTTSLLQEKGTAPDIADVASVFVQKMAHLLPGIDDIKMIDESHVN